MSGADIRAVLFDMDGTLVDTAPDIAVSLNTVLRSNGLDMLAATDITNMVGKGARVLVERAITAGGRNPDDTLVNAVTEQYLREFSHTRGKHGSAFAGGVECLRELHRRGFKLGVVTNAVQRSAEATLAHYGLLKHIDVVFGGDQTSKPKPHPEPLWIVCRKLGIPAAKTLVVGDSANDVAAARAAGCWIACVPHGYNEGRPVEDLGCPIVDRLQDLPVWLESIPAQARSSSAA